MAVRAEQNLPPSVEKNRHPLGFSFALYEPTNIIYNNEDIKKKVGVKKVRRASPHETSEYMMFHAARKVFDSHNPLDFLAVSTSFPTGENLSEMLVDVLGLAVSHRVDVHAACSGYTRALLHLAELGQGQTLDGWNIGFVAAEKYSPYLTNGSFDAGIFTDGAIALSNLVYGENFRIVSATGHHLDTPHDTALRMPVDQTKMVEPFISEQIPPSQTGMFEMQGPVVYRSVIDPRHGVPSLIEEVLEAATLSADDIDYIIPHQGSSRTNAGLMEKLPVFKDKFVTDIQDGNLSSGSIPRALSRLVPEKEMIRVLNVGFGAGLYGAAVITEHGKLT